MLPKPIEGCSGCPLYEEPYGSKTGWVPADGSGRNGVLVVLEAAGQSEAEVGRPTVGKAGHFLWSNLAGVGLERDDFRIHNVLSCQPGPDNKLAGMPYEKEAIAHCSPNLDRTIEETMALAELNGKQFTILTMGKIAFMRIMGLDARSSILKEDYLCYPFWSEQYRCWVIAADHPSHLMRGNHHLIPVMQFATQRAVEIAKNGLELEQHSEYLLDPPPELFREWVKDYKQILAYNPNLVLSYDIETPYKQGKSEDEIVQEDEDHYTILRASFCYRPGHAVSVQWTADYMQMLEELFTSGGIGLGWNNSTYDDPRIKNQLPFNLVSVDGMLAWHILNSALPKSLGFVTPFYVQNIAMWKHLSKEEPARYNAIDADMTLRNYMGIWDGLKENKLVEVFDRHVIKLNAVLNYMSRKGLQRDEEMRKDCEGKLIVLLDETDKKVAEAVPFEARELQVYKKLPKNTTGMVQLTGTSSSKRCPACGTEGITLSHVKSIGKKRLKAGEAENPCAGAILEPLGMVWAKSLEFRISHTSLQRYQKVKGHKPVVDRKHKVITFDKNALKILKKRYPADDLYPLIDKQRYLTKMSSTYIGVTQENGKIMGGTPLSRDGRCHPQYNHNPETLRLACPFFHQLPRPGKPDEPHSWIRNLFVAALGHTYLARDFMGIEAVLVGYEARSAHYIRLAKIDVHSFYTAYALHELDGRVTAADLPDFNWSDEKLIPHLAAIKKEFKTDRNELYKHLTHAINFGQGVQGAQDKILEETNILQPLNKISRVMSIYKELFPEIPRWHQEVRLQADKDGFLRNAFGYVLRLHRVFAWKKEHGQWVRKLGEDAEAVLAFRPQSNAAGIIKEAMLRLYYDRFEEAGQYLRLQIHDELFSEVPDPLLEQVDEVMKEEMERPIVQLALPESYGMGPYLQVMTEAKLGKRWGEMT